MINGKHLSWSPDLRIPAEQHALQEFISHEKGDTLRIILHSDQQARVEVNDRIVAETQGFQNATAMAELYTRDRTVLLTHESKSAKSGATGSYFLIRAHDGEYHVSESFELADFIYRLDSLRPIAQSENVDQAIEAACKESGTSLIPAFMDQQEIYKGLEQQGSTAVIVAIWTSHAQMPILHLVQESEFSPLFLTVSKGRDGSYYTVYRLVNRKYLAELRSQHDAEEIGAFVLEAAAHAYCDLFNTARHCSEWVSFPSSTSKEIISRDEKFFLVEQDNGFSLHAATAQHLSLGQFPNVRLAEAYATVYSDSLRHFDLKTE
jgi:hypothetical protein